VFFLKEAKKHEIIYQKNADKTLPLASLTKLVTAKVAQDEIKKETVSIEKMQELIHMLLILHLIMKMLYFHLEFCMVNFKICGIL
jgi:hypothetical protein